MAEGTSKSIRIHDALGHPVIDADGHWREPLPSFVDHLDAVGGSASVDAFRTTMDRRLDWYRSTDEDRRSRRLTRMMWWGAPSNTFDQATITIPALYHERLGDLGIDFSLLYPTLGLSLCTFEDEDLRIASCRALNDMTAELFGPYKDRIAPVGVVPTYSPEEAVAELTHCVEELGCKTVLIAGSCMRTSTGRDPHRYLDTIALDSPFDYDPFWAKCVELKVPVADHSGSYVWPDRQSVHNFTFNHAGHFANSQHASCRAAFLGGVVQRFPRLRLAFLEGGVGWACQLLSDLVGHYEKRNRPALLENLRPSNVDKAAYLELFERYAPGTPLEGRGQEMLASLYSVSPFVGLEELTEREGEVFEDFAAAGIRSAEHLRSEFCKNFYFGCEADDPMTALAFDERFGKGLKPIFSSDIGHFDVVDMTEVLHEAWELVEDGYINEEAFKRFTFTNVAEMCLSMDPQFFEGTAVGAAVASELVASPS